VRHSAIFKRSHRRSFRVNEEARQRNWNKVCSLLDKSEKESVMRKISRKKVRFAVMGLGHIAQAAVLPAFRNAENCELVALISSDEQKLKALSKQYKVPFTANYEDFEPCLEEAAVDALYIALPNSLHYEYAIRAARAGVHVICEKPLAMNSQDCVEMIEAAESNGVKLMTAYRLHFEEANLAAIKVVKSRKLGDPRIFHSVFSMQVTDKDNIRLQHQMGGGPTFDLGIYAINAMRYIFESEPVEVTAFVERKRDDKRFEEVEEMISAVLRFPGERLATFTASFGAADSSFYEIIGTKGKLCVDPAFEYAEGLKHCLTIGEKVQEKSFKKRDQFAPELIYFADSILSGREIEPSGYEGLADVLIMEALFESADRGKAIALNIEARTQRPSLRQEMHKPALRSMPRLVHARSAH
jgi:predicted dehydrogenase